MAVHFCVAALELQNDGQYKRNLTLTMLNAYLVAGGTDNEDYCYSLCGLTSRLDDELLAIRYMDKPQADTHMVKEKLHYKEINASASKTYRKQFDQGE